MGLDVRLSDAAVSIISELQEKGKEVTLVWVSAHVGKSCYNKGYN